MENLNSVMASQVEVIEDFLMETDDDASEDQVDSYQVNKVNDADVSEGEEEYAVDDTPKLSYEQLLETVGKRDPRVMLDKLSIDMLTMMYPSVNWEDQIAGALEELKKFNDNKLIIVKSRSLARKKGMLRPIKRKRRDVETLVPSDNESDGGNDNKVLSSKRRVIKPSKFSDYVCSKNPATVTRKVIKSPVKAERLEMPKLKSKYVLKESRMRKSGPGPKSAKMVTISGTLAGSTPNKKVLVGSKGNQRAESEKALYDHEGMFAKKHSPGIVLTVTPQESSSASPSVTAFASTPNALSTDKTSHLNGFKLISNFEQLVEQLRFKRLLESPVECLLLKNFSSSQIYELMRCKSKENGNKEKKAFSKLQLKFALSMYLYAPKCFRFLKTLFLLPSGKSLCRMVDGINGNLGFFSEVLLALKNIVARSNNRDYCIVIDSVDICREDDWDTDCHGIFGARQFCHTLEVDQNLASEVIIVMAVSLRDQVKLPIGYFAMDGQWPGLLARLIDMSVTKLTERGMNVWAVTLDASERSYLAVQQLGCSYNPLDDSTKSSFFHLSSKTQVNILFDMHHIVQLARNISGCISSPEGEVNMNCIKLLYPSLYKICKRNQDDPVKWRNCVIQSLLSFHSMSKSVSQGIEFMRSTGEVAFENTLATCTFINYLNDICDLANSCSPFSREYNQSITRYTLEIQVDFISKAVEYLKSLEIDCGFTAVDDKLHPFIHRCLLTLHSINNIIVEVFKKTKIKTLSMHRFSLDSIDIVRATIGGDRKPNLLQIKQGLMDIVYENLHEYSTFYYPAPTILQFRSAKRSFRRVCQLRGNYSLTLVVSLMRGYIYKEHYRRVIITIGRIILLDLSKRLTCSSCIGMLRKDMPVKGQHDYSLLTWERSLKHFEDVNNYPSDSLIKLLDICEREFSSAKLLCVSKSKFSLEEAILHLVMMKLVNGRFPFVVYHHDIVTEFGESIHEYQLARLVCQMYISARLRSSTAMDIICGS